MKDKQAKFELGLELAYISNEFFDEMKVVEEKARFCATQAANAHAGGGGMQEDIPEFEAELFDAKVKLYAADNRLRIVSEAASILLGRQRGWHFRVPSHND